MEGLVFLGVMFLLIQIGLFFIKRASKYEAGILVQCSACHLDFRKTYLTSFERDVDAAILDDLHSGHKPINVEMWEFYRD